LIGHSFQVFGDIHCFVRRIWSQLFVQTFSDVRRELGLLNFAENAQDMVGMLENQVASVEFMNSARHDVCANPTKYRGQLQRAEHQSISSDL